MSTPIVPRHLRELQRLAREQGWDLTPRPSGHWRFLHPDGRIFVDCPSTRSENRRGQRNLIARLRRAGLSIPHDRGLLE